MAEKTEDQAKVKNNTKLTCDKCKGPIDHTEGLTEEDKEIFREAFDEDFFCDNCLPAGPSEDEKQKILDELIKEEQEFLEENFEEFDPEKHQKL